MSQHAEPLPPKLREVLVKALASAIVAELPASGILPDSVGEPRAKIDAPVLPSLPRGNKARRTRRSTAKIRLAGID